MFFQLRRHPVTAGVVTIAARLFHAEADIFVHVRPGLRKNISAHRFLSSVGCGRCGFSPKGCGGGSEGQQGAPRNEVATCGMWHGCFPPQNHGAMT